MAIQIFADAGSNLFAPWLREKQIDIHVVSMTLDINGQAFHCYDDDIDVKDFGHNLYGLLRDGADVKTSLPNPMVWKEAFETATNAGDQVVCFTMSGKISGTFQSACLAASLINDEKGSEYVHVIDSKTAGFGEGLQAIHAYELVRKGHPFEVIYQFCEDYVQRIRSEFTVGHIKYLAKTGRVSPFVAKIAAMLNIKPILKGSTDGEIVLVKKFPGMLASLRCMAKTVAEHIVTPAEQTVMISHCDAEEDALKLKELLEREGVDNVEIVLYDVVTGSHVGPGTVAVFYMGNNRD